MMMMGKMCSSPCRRLLLLLLSKPSLPQQATLIQRAAKSYSNGMLRFYSQLPPQRLPGPLSLYRSLVKEGKLQYDFYQERVASELEDLLRRLEQYEMDMEEYHVNLANWEKKRENERRRLLMEEAEAKQQQGGVRKSINKQRNGFFEK